MYQLNDFDIELFLREYWQKKPLVIRQGFKDFIDPLDEHELAGLALEDNIDSRIVSLQDLDWQVTQGPFADINAHCQGAWSLLVQAVDHYVPEADELMRAFSFIPHWRMTDLMVSFSNQGAGVGAHIDQYDVFIIQGKGSRRWQVGLPSDYAVKLPHPALKQIEDFAPIIDEVLEPGDIIYIPPHHPHNGVAQQDCMNYSVGFRAPSQQEMFASFSDYVAEHNLFTERYVDHVIEPREYGGEIKPHEVKAFKQFMLQALDKGDFDDWLSAYLSESYHAKDPNEQDTEPYSEQEIAELLAEGALFIRENGLKAIFQQNSQNPETDFVFYIEGQRFSCPSSINGLVKELLNNSEFSLDNHASNQDSQALSPLLSSLVNAGFWFVE